MSIRIDVMNDGCYMTKQRRDSNHDPEETHLEKRKELRIFVSWFLVGFSSREGVTPIT